MTRDEIFAMAREVGMFYQPQAGWIAGLNHLERLAALVAAAERTSMMQLFTDPENQPTQHGTVTVEYMQREIAAEREACAQAAEDMCEYGKPFSAAAAIRARGKA